MRPKHYILYLLVLLTAYFGFNAQWGYLAGSEWWTHLTFHFAHGNIFHLAANMLVVFLVIFLRQDHWWLWPVAFVMAVLCSFMVSTPKPTVGLSGVLFAYYGIVFIKDGIKWKSLLYTLAYMAVTCLFVIKMAVGLHFLCLASGLLIGCIMRLKSNIEREVRLYDR